MWTRWRESNTKAERVRVMKPSKSKYPALCGLMIALSFALSYLEHLLPLPVGVPGVKLGLANLVVVMALYLLPVKQAFFIAAARVLFAGLTFGNAFSLLYSAAGGALSFLAMLLLKRTRLSAAGVSVAGGVSHNIGQLIVAAFAMGTARLAYYLPVLLASGLGAGLLVGLIAAPVIDRLRKTAFGNDRQ